MKHLKHTYKISETLENIRLHHALSAQHISLLLGRMKACRLVEFIRDSGPAALVGSDLEAFVGGGLAAAVAQYEKEVVPA
jgi:hypothetical protein